MKLAIKDEMTEFGCSLGTLPYEKEAMCAVSKVIDTQRLSTCNEK